MNILVTGGAGYIGSHMVRMLSKIGTYSITVVDSLENGFAPAVPSQVKLVKQNISDREGLERIFEKGKFDAVIHFAGYLMVEESVRNPVKYFRNNLIGALTLLETMEKFHVKLIIFSSTAAVYGFPKTVPIPESHPKCPESPYGLSKWNFEQMLSIYDRRNAIRSMSLRYFNASGASLDSMYGEFHQPETHLIPLAIETALGRRKEFYLFGTDYETRDGTCERDFIHIEDLCTAHIMALDALSNGHTTDIYNVATGHGVTNKEMITEIKKQTKIDFPVIEKGRRPGDPSILVADSTRIQKELGWKPKYSDLGTIVSTALKWHRSHPKGYGNQ
jgi:UDP-glucose 4-epimerase